MASIQSTLSLQTFNLLERVLNIIQKQRNTTQKMFTKNQPILNHIPT